MNQTAAIFWLHGAWWISWILFVVIKSTCICFTLNAVPYWFIRVFALNLKSHHCRCRVNYFLYFVLLYRINWNYTGVPVIENQIRKGKTYKSHAKSETIPALNWGNVHSCESLIDLYCIFVVIFAGLKILEGRFQILHLQGVHHQPSNCHWDKWEY